MHFKTCRQCGENYKTDIPTSKKCEDCKEKNRLSRLIPKKEIKLCVLCKKKEVKGWHICKNCRPSGRLKRIKIQLPKVNRHVKKKR